MPIDRRTLILGAAAVAAGRPAETATGLPTSAPPKAGTATPSADGAAPDKAPAATHAPTERVLGIGGLFFRSHDPKTLAEWYRQNLGIDQQVWQQAAGPTAFTPFPADTDYFGAKQQAWMVNFRVRNLDAMVAQLQRSNIEVKVDPEKYPYGRFARLHDPDGNPVELWEPASPP